MDVRITEKTWPEQSSSQENAALAPQAFLNHREHREHREELSKNSVFSVVNSL
jgi:hypothetical protein